MAVSWGFWFGAVLGFEMVRGLGVMGVAVLFRVWLTGSIESRFKGWGLALCIEVHFGLGLRAPFYGRVGEGSVLLHLFLASYSPFTSS